MFTQPKHTFQLELKEQSPTQYAHIQETNARSKCVCTNTHHHTCMPFIMGWDLGDVVHSVCVCMCVCLRLCSHSVYRLLCSLGTELDCKFHLFSLIERVSVETPLAVLWLPCYFVSPVGMGHCSLLSRPDKANINDSCILERILFMLMEVEHTLYSLAQASWISCECKASP